MPFKSEAQRRAMYAAASGKGKLGISRSAARKFISHSTRKRRNPGAAMMAGG